MAELDRVEMLRRSVRQKAYLEPEEADLLLNHIDAQANQLAEQDAQLADRDIRLGVLDRKAQVQDGIIRILGRKLGMPKASAADIAKELVVEVTKELATDILREVAPDDSPKGDDSPKQAEETAAVAKS